MSTLDLWSWYRVGSDWPPEMERRLKTELLESLRATPLAEASDMTAAEQLLDLVYRELAAYGTDGANECGDEEIAVAIRTLEAVTRRLGVPVKLPFRDLTQ